MRPRRHALPLAPPAPHPLALTHQPRSTPAAVAWWLPASAAAAARAPCLHGAPRRLPLRGLSAAAGARIAAPRRGCALLAVRAAAMQPQQRHDCSDHRRIKKKTVWTFSRTYACHPCAGAMLILRQRRDQLHTSWSPAQHWGIGAALPGSESYSRAWNISVSISAVSCTVLMRSLPSRTACADASLINSVGAP